VKIELIKFNKKTTIVHDIRDREFKNILRKFICADRILCLLLLWFYNEIYIASDEKPFKLVKIIASLYDDFNGR
jgi:hypothetical protein